MSTDLPAYYYELGPRERQHVRKLYAEQQKGKCFYCHYKLENDPPKHILRKKINWKLFPKGFLDYPIHLQHDHDTGLTEGVVHAYCNAVMWQYEQR